MLCSLMTASIFLTLELRFPLLLWQLFSLSVVVVVEEDDTCPICAMFLLFGTPPTNLNNLFSLGIWMLLMEALGRSGRFLHDWGGLRAAEEMGEAKQKLVFSMATRGLVPC